MQLKKFLPHFIAILAFALITFFQFKPLYSGKVLNQYDISQHKGMSKEISDFRAEEKTEPLWTNSMFGGMPAYQISVLYPGNLMSVLDNIFHLFLTHPSGIMFMYFLGFFILLLCLEINPWLAFIGALAYGFSSYFYIILEVGHNSKANAVGYLAPALGGIILLMRGKYFLGFSLTTLFMALELNTNHLQVTYYGLILYGFVILAYLFYSFQQKTIRAFLIGASLFVLAAGISLLPNMGNLMCTYQYGKDTTRGKSELTINASGGSNKENATSGLDKDYAVQYSYGVGETFSFLIPNFKGGDSGNPISNNKNALENVEPQMRQTVGQFSSYFGPQDYTAGPVYIGAIIILLAFLGLLIIDHPLKWALFFATILSVMLAWGKNFMGLSSFFLDYVPGYNKFRAVSIINIIAELTIPLLAILAIDQLIKNTSGKEIKIPFLKKTYSTKKVFLFSAIVIGGFCLLCYQAPNLVNTFTQVDEQSQIANQFKRSGYAEKEITQMMPPFMENLVIARISIFKSDAMRSFIFILLASIFIYLFIVKKINANLLIASLGLFFVIDLWQVANRYLNEKSFVAKSKFDGQAMTNADQDILKDKSLDYRVLNIAASPFQDAKTSYYHKSIGGYHGAKLKKYHELMEFHLLPEMREFQEQIRNVYTNDTLRNLLYSKMNVLNMLNTKYIIYPTREEPVVITNTQTNGSVWLIKDIKVVANADSEIVALYKLNTKQSCVVQQKNKGAFPLQEKYSGEGTITLTAYKANNLIYKSETNSKQFAVFSEIYYADGWNAYIDGKATQHVCVNYLLRGMEIPMGQHSIEFKFEPQVYKTGNTIAYAGSIFVYLIVFGGLFFSLKKKEVKF